MLFELEEGRGKRVGGVAEERAIQVRKLNPVGVGGAPVAEEAG